MIILVFVIIIILSLMFGLPVYNRWRAGVSGQAELNQAEYNRKIATLEAKQKMENEAEVIRARGVAQANKIIVDGLGGPEGYLHYLWIQSLSQDGKSTPQIIYVPSEANLPILEANRLKTNTKGD